MSSKKVYFSKILDSDACFGFSGLFSIKSTCFSLTSWNLTKLLISFQIRNHLPITELASTSAQTKSTEISWQVIAMNRSGKNFWITWLHAAMVTPQAVSPRATHQGFPPWLRLFPPLHQTPSGFLILLRRHRQQANPQFSFLLVPFDLKCQWYHPRSVRRPLTYIKSAFPRQVRRTRQQKHRCGGLGKQKEHCSESISFNISNKQANWHVIFLRKLFYCKRTALSTRFNFHSLCFVSNYCI